MRVVGFCGLSGSGKTTLIERLLALMRARGQRVSVIKHAGAGFDIDRAGKDSFRHRQAGAFEVLLASDQRLVKLREYEVPGPPTVHQLVAELHDCDWVFVEGFKHADMPKVEVLGPVRRGDPPPLYLDDPFVVALATDAPEALPVPTGRPVFARADARALAQFLFDSSARYEYRFE